ncbi:uncharacterized protein TNIN_398611 [Trichonephila inaurata madagascariensis]|uniref:Uncharacterized protein n=1 Tax=Trichonephila inaurata madagascariensis TaxID=2747483 RepID=A0A8X6MJ49_9ARAC|nr:uncharacterized protein TNIN_398611 [Trichonephila inaurata madagascariensis]
MGRECGCRHELWHQQAKQSRQPSAAGKFPVRHPPVASPPLNRVLYDRIGFPKKQIRGGWLNFFVATFCFIYAHINFAVDNDNRRDIFRANEENQRIRPQQQPSSQTSSTTQKAISSSTNAAPATLSPQEETDVNAIISKLISASGAANGGNGPRFVVVAPLPDNAEVPQNSAPVISRADNIPSTRPHSRDDNPQSPKNHPQDSWQVSNQRRPEPDLLPAASSQGFQIVQAPVGRSANPSNLTNRIGLSGNDAANRRMSPKHFMMGASGNGHNGGGSFHNAQIDLTGFEPFDTMMHELQASQSVQKPHQNPPPPNFGGSFNPKRGPPQGHFNGRNQHKPLGMQQFDPKDQHIFHHHMPAELNPLGLQGSSNHPQGMIAPPPPGIGLKPIQQQMHHIDPLQAQESNRWGYHGPPSGAYVPHKPPEGISLAISSPANSGTHVSAEPVNVIKSFFLPFLPKPRLNMNARVVFGVVLDKGMGIGGDKKKSHPYR